MKLLKYISLAAIALILTGCAKDVRPAEETVEVSFTAGLPQAIGTRAGDDVVAEDPYKDYMIICAVYEDGAEIRTLRDKISKNDEGKFIFNPRLVKGHEYEIVFWAMKEGMYDISKDAGLMERISRVPADEQNNFKEADYDAFTFVTEEFIVNEDTNEAVELVRPFAQLNLGVSKDDWEAVKALGQTPAKVILKVERYESYNAYEGEVAGELTSAPVEMAVTEGVRLPETEYEQLSSRFVFVDGLLIGNVEYEIYDTAGTLIVRNGINLIPLQPNYRTNIVGDLMTGTVSYSISLSTGLTDL